jgi:hypothetical protein
MFGGRIKMSERVKGEVSFYSFGRRLGLTKLTLSLGLDETLIK